MADADAKTLTNIISGGGGVCTLVLSVVLVVHHNDDTIISHAPPLHSSLVGNRQLRPILSPASIYHSLVKYSKSDVACNLDLTNFLHLLCYCRATIF